MNHQHGPATASLHDMHLQTVAYIDAVAGKRNFLGDPLGKIGRRQLLHGREVTASPPAAKAPPAAKGVSGRANLNPRGSRVAVSGSPIAKPQTANPLSAVGGLAIRGPRSAIRGG